MFRIKVENKLSRFNPSQVQFTQYLVEEGGYMGTGFQSLTGSIHTSIFKLFCQGFQRVSIPHRFNSHRVQDPTKKGEIVFQSLTGSIHTYEIGDWGDFAKLFQSLTGSIHTS